MPPSSPNNAKQPFFGVKVSKPGIPVQNATNQQLVFENNYDTTTYYDKNNARVVQGLLPDGSYGMWVSKVGYDATSATAAAAGNLAFNSGASFTIVISGSYTFVSQSISPGETTFLKKIAHGLTYVPGYAAFSLSYDIFAGSAYSYTVNVSRDTVVQLTGSVGADVSATASAGVDSNDMILVADFTNNGSAAEASGSITISYVVYTFIVP